MVQNVLLNIFLLGNSLWFYDIHLILLWMMILPMIREHHKISSFTILSPPMLEMSSKNLIARCPIVVKVLICHFFSFKLYVGDGRFFYIWLKIFVIQLSNSFWWNQIWTWKFGLRNRNKVRWTKLKKFLLDRYPLWLNIETFENNFDHDDDNDNNSEDDDNDGDGDKDVRWEEVFL